MSVELKTPVWHHPDAQLRGPVLRHKFASAAAIVNISGDRVLIAYGGPVNPHNQPPGTCRIYACFSDDECRTWSAEREMIHLPQCQAIDPVFLRLHDGSLMLFHLGFYASVWDESGSNPDMYKSRSDLWAARSYDEGETWCEHRIVFRGYTGATNGAIQTDAGLIVIPFSYDVTNPGRLVSACLISCDNGETFQLGQAVDIGQCGDHAGALEPAVIELRANPGGRGHDGRLLMFIRTSLGQFLQSFSDDGGFSWSEPQRSQFRSPSSPCHVTRLASGRMAIIWNNTMGTTNGRTSLHMALSDNQGDTWTSPVEVIRALGDEKPQVSYPFIYEYQPGVMLVRFNHVGNSWQDVHGRIFRIREDTLLET